MDGGCGPRAGHAGTARVPPMGKARTQEDADGNSAIKNTNTRLRKVEKREDEGELGSHM